MSYIRLFFCEHFRCCFPPSIVRYFSNSYTSISHKVSRVPADSYFAGQRSSVACRSSAAGAGVAGCHGYWTELAARCGIMVHLFRLHTGGDRRHDSRPYVRSKFPPVVVISTFSAPPQFCTLVRKLAVHFLFSSIKFKYKIYRMFLVFCVQLVLFVTKELLCYKLFFCIKPFQCFMPLQSSHRD